MLVFMKLVQEKVISEHMAKMCRK